jgi:hypothetical protein
MLLGDLHYEQLVEGFKSKRQELLELITQLVPRPTDLHRRRWRLQILENAISDLKTALGACNDQIDKDRVELDEKNDESMRLRAQERKLYQDVKLLEGASGVKAQFPDSIQSEAFQEVETLSQSFRDRFSDFLSSIPPIRQTLPIDVSLERDCQILVSTMEDYAQLLFDARSSDACLSKEAKEKTEVARNLERAVKAKDLQIQREIEVSEKKIRSSAQKMKSTMEQQAKNLKTEERKVQQEYQQTIGKLKHSTKDLKEQQSTLARRVESLENRNLAMRENLRRKAMDIEIEIDRLVRKFAFIRDTPESADHALINTSLLLEEGPSPLDKAVLRLRSDIEEFRRDIEGWKLG